MSPPRVPSANDPRWHHSDESVERLNAKWALLGQRLLRVAPQQRHGVLKYHFRGRMVCWVSFAKRVALLDPLTSFRAVLQAQPVQAPDAAADPVRAWASASLAQVMLLAARTQKELRLSRSQRRASLRFNAQPEVPLRALADAQLSLLKHLQAKPQSFVELSEGLMPEAAASLERWVLELLACGALSTRPSAASASSPAQPAWVEPMFSAQSGPHHEHAA